MYFLTALVCTLIAGGLWLAFRNRNKLHLEILAIIYGAATLMWLIDCFSGLINEGVFLSFDDPNDGWIAVGTLIGGIFLWLVISFILNNKEKTSEQIEQK